MSYSAGLASSSTKQEILLYEGIEVTDDIPSTMPVYYPATTIKEEEVATTISGSDVDRTIIVETEYGNLLPPDARLVYPWLETAFLMEPFKNNTMTITSASFSSDCTLDWTLIKDEAYVNADELINMAMGAPIISFAGSVPVVDGVAQILAQPQSTEKYNLVLTQECSNVTLQEVVWVKYIRRELKRLTADDQEKFLNAINMMWRVNTVDGIALYGPRYKSAYYFNQIHIDASGNGVCDMFHGGIGFLNNHLYITNYFEQSMRLIEPSTSLHYLEYAEMFGSEEFQNHKKNILDGGRSLTVLSDEWFGNSDPTTGEIVTSRFKSIECPRPNTIFYELHGIPVNKTFFPQNEDGWFKSLPYAHTYSMYGLARSQHSFSTAPYVQRFFSVDNLTDVTWMKYDDEHDAFDHYEGVQCKDYVTFLWEDAIGAPLETIAKKLEDKTHGPIHRAFGGAGGVGDLYLKNDEEWRRVFNFTDADLVHLSYVTHPYMKNNGPRLFRDPASLSIPSVWNCSNIPGVMYNLEDINGPDEMWKTLPEAGSPGGVTCDAVDYIYHNETEVDHFLTRSTKKHPVNFKATIARLLADYTFEEKKYAVKLLNQRYQIDGDMGSSAAAIDPLFWIQHGGVQRFWQTLHYEQVFSDYSFSTTNVCSGHSAEGVLGWLDGYYFSNPSIKTANIQQHELMEMLDPTSDAYRDFFNYVYESTNYEWCPGIMEAFGNKTEIMARKILDAQQAEIDIAAAAVAYQQEMDAAAAAAAAQ